MIVLDGDCNIIGEYTKPVPLEPPIFQAAAVPPLRPVTPEEREATAFNAVYHIVTFEKDRYRRTDGSGGSFWALKIIDGAEHIDRVPDFYRMD